MTDFVHLADLTQRSGDDTMRRQLLTLAVAGVLGVLVASEAQACHKKKCACPPPASVCVVETVPCPPPAPVCEPAPKKSVLFRHNPGCGHQRVKLGGLCHKKPACE